MKYSTVILALVASVFAVPQEGSTITSAPASMATGLTPQQSCVVACAAGDVNCQADCVGSAHPNTAQVLDTNACAARCDQGDGSPDSAQRFSDCIQACINGIYLYFSTAADGAVVSYIASETNSVAASGALTLSSGTGALATGADVTNIAAATSAPTGAANSHSIQITGAGVAGLFALFAF